ncbi:MAG: hypothetical protein PF485_03445 [Bacteroidales bacterium]|nr:hypothetical protein [Bacteroidales bacterium]
MLRRFFCLILLFLVVNSLNLKAQYYSAGQDPASAKWSQIKTDNFQIIFQPQFKDKAQKVANILESNYQNASKTLDHQSKKISVILHNQTVISNGYVVWAPKRMELYTTPPQDISPDAWLEHLCIHELRHVVQIDKLNQGISKILSIIFGQHAIGLIVGQLPIWYLEGDAVCTETALLKFGRGRLPFFEQGIKTHLLSDEKRYSFDKMLFGSYRDYVPNHYELGYQLTAFTRFKYGSTIWSDIENYVAKNSYTLLPTSYSFYKGLKKNIGLSQKELFNEAYNFLDSSWASENDKKEFIKPKYFQTYNIGDYENYINPVIVDDKNVLALKKGLSHIPYFVIVNETSEHLLYEPGLLITNDFSYANDVIVWAEYRPDRRWSNREYTSIKMLNIKTGKRKLIVDKSRYFSPNLSPKADKIVAVEVDVQNKSSLVIIDGFNGLVLDEIQSRENSFIQRPQWSWNEKYIYVIEQTKEWKQVSRYNFKLNKWEFVFKLEGGDIQRIKPLNGYVYFHSTYNGTDNIYVYDEKTEQIYQISESEFGISEFDISANKYNLISSEYTSQGFRLAVIPIERGLWKNINQTQNYKFELAEVLTEQESFSKPIVNESQTEFPVKPFRKPLNLFNFHSWIPFYVDYEQMLSGNAISDPSIISENIHPGLMLLSQNKLSTMESMLSYAYKGGNHFLSSSLVFKGQYPVFKLSANYGNNQLIRTTSNATWQPESNLGYSYDLDIYVPFNFTSGKFIKGFRPLVSVEYHDDIYYNYQNDYYIRGVEFVQTGLLFYSYQIKANRDIIPKLGVIFDFNLFNSPFESELFGYLYNFDALFYLPGWGNSGFKIDLGYQFQEPCLYRLTSNFRFPRGINKRTSDKMFKIYSDYIFPISYPDWNLGSFIYIKRFRGNLFIDYAYNTYRTVNESQTAYIFPIEHNFSFGLELTADYHLLRTIFPLNTGIRVGYIPTENKILFDFIFGIDLFNL